jgi:hypothetical protein
MYTPCPTKAPNPESDPVCDRRWWLVWNKSSSDFHKEYSLDDRHRKCNEQEDNKGDEQQQEGRQRNVPVMEERYVVFLLAKVLCVLQ